MPISPGFSCSQRWGLSLEPIVFHPLEARGVVGKPQKYSDFADPNHIMQILFSQDQEDLEFLCQAGERDLWAQDPSVY